MLIRYYSKAEESLGMAQTFTIVSALIEGIGTVVKDRVNKRETAKAEKEKAEEEVRLSFEFGSQTVTRNVSTG